MRLVGRQLAIMKVLWEYGEASVAQVKERLPVAPPLAYSTISTVLSRMERKGLVTHHRADRVYVYRPAVSQDQAGQTMVGEMVRRICDGSPSQLVNHLLESDQVDSKELKRIKKLIEAHEARLNKNLGKSP
ncbi:MAG: BlaI/MecI/CopY family transcriptional regulator [Pirellulaceae bacterium]|nr:BlaI/MecI/CopY family transcriptional regulator [Pirellulaceae bacterium]